MRRALRVLAVALSALIALPVLAVIAVFVLLNVDPGRRLAERLIGRITANEVVVTGLSGRFPDRLRVAHAEVRDARGAWVSLDGVALDWSPSALLHGTALVQRLSADHVQVPRLPEPAASASAGGSSFTLPVQVDVAAIHIARADIGAPVAGAAASIGLDGRLHLTSLQQGDADVTLRSRDGAGVYLLRGRLDPLQVQAHFDAAEPARGLIASLAHLPNLGALAIQADLDGPKTAVGARLTLAAGPLRAQAQGTIDLDRSTADVDMHATAPAMQPRADVAWRAVVLDAHVHGPFTTPNARGTLNIDGLAAGGAALRTLSLKVAGNAGQVGLHAVATGLRIPGPKPDLLEANPITLEADSRLDALDRPVRFSLDHPLLSASGNVQTGGDIAGTVKLTLPSLAPFAAMAAVDLDGSTSVTLNAAIKGEDTKLDLDGVASVSGGMAPVPGLIGEAAKLSAAATVHGSDVTISHASVDGRSLHAALSGTDRAGVLDLDWRLALSDLSVLAATLRGEVAANGRMHGQPERFAVDAEASGAVGSGPLPPGPIKLAVHAVGLPTAPTGTLTAEGTLDNAPLALSAQVRREGDGTLRVTIEKADWKSAHVEGQAVMARGAALPAGRLELRMTRLEDLRALIGQPIRGSITATADLPEAGEARLQVEARDAGIPGNAVSRLTVDARVADPMTHPVVTARAQADAIAAAGLAGSATLTADGPQDALSLRLTAALRDLGGADAAISAAAMVDAVAKRLQLSALQAAWKGQAARLLAPARIDLAQGVAIDRLRLGLGAATVEIAGRASPTLDLTAALRNVTPDLVKPFAPDIDADGTLTGDAHLTGTPTRPQGTIRLAAVGVHMRSGPGRALPPANLNATATLNGVAARIDAKLAVGHATQVTINGTAPIDPRGALALRVAGALDLAIADPILAANGRRVRGRVTLDATVNGPIAAPRIGGSVRLADGEVQDFAQGVHLTKLAALVEAQGDTLRLASLTAAAGPGTISANGTVGVLAAGLPVDLHILMKNARPLASDLLTANLDADLTLRGTAQQQIGVGGKILVRRADITVPDRLPTSVAVLNVRRIGQKPPPPPAPAPVIGLALTVDAPRAIFVRGHGLDAELGGEVKLAGTTAAPQIQGGFDMRNGTFSLVGQTLTFSRGRVGFDGTGIRGRIDPTLDFEIDAVNGTTTAKLLVGGYADAPKITLSSSPELPQDEVLAQLLYGRSTKDLGPFQIAGIAAALASITGVGGIGADPLASVRNALGLDRLSVGSGATTNSASIEAGRYVANGVFVGAKQGTSGASTQLEVQVDLFKGLKLETDIGTGSNSAAGAAGSSGSNVGLTYQFEY